MRLASVMAWPTQLRLPSRHFSLFLAMDATGIPDHDISELADQALSQGAAIVSTWGQGCERVHDLFDREIIDRLHDENDENVIMTVWHDDKTLADSLWDFLHTYMPAPAYRDSCTSWLAVSIGRNDWADQITGWLGNIEKLNGTVLGPDDAD
jgi:hypothetical protein